MSEETPQIPSASMPEPTPVYVPTPVAGPPASRGRLGSAVLPVSGVIILALVARWIFGLLPGHGSGAGPAASTTGTTGMLTTDNAPPKQTTPPATPAPLDLTNLPAVGAGPLEITVRNDRYFVGGKDVSAEQIIAALAASKLPADAPRAKIIKGGDSRIGAEKSLETALDNAHILYRTESGPDTRP